MKEQELTWKDAIVKVLREEKKALHYTEIAELIAEREYRKSLGATPKDTVYSQIYTEINTKNQNSKFKKVDRGVFILREFFDSSSQPSTEEKQTEKISQETTEKIRIINSYGIYWNRNLVDWGLMNPNLLGIQQKGATEVNFQYQVGIYLLHDNRETIYVGQAIDQSLGKRLKQHTTDRMSGRWDRFSWFGFYPVSDNAELDKDIKFENLTVQDLGNILEAILIESMEPRQNRKQGNLFSGIEYLQQEDTAIKKKRQEDLLSELKGKL